MAPRRAQGLVLQRDPDRGQAVVTFTAGDVDYLRSAPGNEALREVAAFALTEASLLGDIAAVRRRFGQRTAVLVETVRLRRRASTKLADAAGWLLTDEALQQATATPVARHRAARLAGRRVHDVTCSVGAELVELNRQAAMLLGSDIDPVRLAMARTNVPEVALCRADALRPVTSGTVVVADPARRSGGRRRFDPGQYCPPLGALLDAHSGRDLAVKCAPGVDFDRLAFDGEVEVTSVAGEVREACLWSAGLAEPGLTRRATVLAADGRCEQITDAEPQTRTVAAAGRWIVDPDGAVVRAGLVRHYAARHGLWQLDPRIAYLSGNVLPPGVRGFEVIEQLPLAEKRLRHALAALDCGALEILVRGVDVDPHRLRRRLTLRGVRALALVITRIGTGAGARAVAFVCRAGTGAGAAGTLAPTTSGEELR